VKLLIRLLRGTDNQPVDATLLNLTQKHVNHFRTQWQSALIESVQVDKYWDWAFKHRIADTYDNQECYAIECNGDTPGLFHSRKKVHKPVN
jgi:hypothetical protein